MYDYSKIYLELQTTVGLFIFFKKNGELRVMLGTRSLDIARIQYGWISGELGKMDNRCNISNGNLGLIDLSIGEGRCFNINRLSYYKNLGTVSTEEEYNNMITLFNRYNEEYKRNMSLSMDMINNTEGNSSNTESTGIMGSTDVEKVFDGGLTI